MLIDALPEVGLHLGPAASLLIRMLVAAVVMMTAPVGGRRAGRQVSEGGATLPDIVLRHDYE